MLIQLFLYKSSNKITPKGDYDMSNILDTKTIIVNLLKEDKKIYLSIERLQNLLTFIQVELSKRNKLGDYTTFFSINFNAIERTVLYNNSIFKLDITGEMIYLREEKSADALAEQYKISEEIKTIIIEFIETTAA